MKDIFKITIVLSLLTCMASYAAQRDAEMKAAHKTNIPQLPAIKTSACPTTVNDSSSPAYRKLAYDYLAVFKHPNPAVVFVTNNQDFLIQGAHHKMADGSFRQIMHVNEQAAKTLPIGFLKITWGAEAYKLTEQTKKISQQHCAERKAMVHFRCSKCIGEFKEFFLTLHPELEPIQPILNKAHAASQIAIDQWIAKFKKDSDLAIAPETLERAFSIFSYRPRINNACPNHMVKNKTKKIAPNEREKS